METTIVYWGYIMIGLGFIVFLTLRISLPQGCKHILLGVILFVSAALSWAESGL